MDATETLIYDMEDPWRSLFECVSSPFTAGNVSTSENSSAQPSPMTKRALALYAIEK